MDMFNDMVRQVYSLKDAKKTVVVGFAETATAIGAYVAACLNLPYIIVGGHILCVEHFYIFLLEYNALYGCHAIHVSVICVCSLKGVFK